jgi:hypothetical protein
MGTLGELTQSDERGWRKKLRDLDRKGGAGAADARLL